MVQITKEQALKALAVSYIKARLALIEQQYIAMKAKLGEFEQEQDTDTDKFEEQIGDVIDIKLDAWEKLDDAYYAEVDRIKGTSETQSQNSMED
jgi:hypothetical protein